MTRDVPGCTGKQRHNGRAEAQAHLVSLFKTLAYRGHVYRCPHCGFWHVGRNVWRHRGRRG